MVTSLLKRIALLAGVSLAAITAAVATAKAQDSGALLDALVRKGILSDQEAEEIRVDLTKESHNAMLSTIAGGKSTTALSITGRLQIQYAGLDTNAEGAGADPDSVEHFFLRRVYLGASAKLGPNWSAQFNYDFAGAGSFDKAFIRWEGEVWDQNLAIDTGLRKVNFGFEETTSSGSLKAIERSGVTRYFMEDANGRRLGGGSYRIGVFADFNSAAAAGKETGIFYSAAITNPERVSDTSSVGDATNNGTPAFWAGIGYSGKAGSGKYITGAAAGYMPDQGGHGTAAPYGRGTGNDLSVASIYGSVNVGRFTLAAEGLIGRVENGSVAGENATQWGFWVQPSCMITDKLEAVVRYSFLDTDGRGVRVSDGIRSAASIGGLRNELNEYYAGLNYYFQGSDVVLQLGYVGGKSSGDVTGAAGRDEKVNGIRTQLQVNF